MTSAPKVEQTPDEWLFTWPDEVLSLRVGRVTVDKQGAMHAELTPYTLVNGEPRTIAAPARYNLTGPRGKKEAAEALHRRRNSSEEWAWGDALEQVALRVLEDRRRGEPAYRARDVHADDKVEYLIYPYLPLGEASVIFSDNSTGKSALGQFLCYAVAAGLKLPNASPPTQSGPILYLDWEHNHPKAVSRRFRWIAQGLGHPDIHPDLHILVMSEPLIEDVDRVKRAVQDIGPALVVVDSLGWAAHDDPAESQVAIRLMNTIRNLGTTALAIAHISKADRSNPNSRRSIYGSAFFEHGVRMAWEVRAEHESWGLAQQLYHRKGNEGRLLDPQHFRLVFSRESERTLMTLEQGEEPQPKQQRESIEARVVEALSRAKRPVSLSDLAKQLDTSSQSISPVLKALPNVSNLNPNPKGPGSWVLDSRAKQWSLEGTGDERVACGGCGELELVDSYDPVTGSPRCHKCGVAA